MTKPAITREQWEAVRDWESELTQSLPAFQVNFMTDAEIQHSVESKPAAASLDDETEKHLLDEMEAWEDQRKAELLAFAQRLGCSLYLAAYLRHLNDKLDYIADVFGNNKVVMQEPPSRK